MSKYDEFEENKYKTANFFGISRCNVIRWVKNRVAISSDSNYTDKETRRIIEPSLRKGKNLKGENDYTSGFVVCVRNELVSVNSPYWTICIKIKNKILDPSNDIEGNQKNWQFYICSVRTRHILTKLGRW